MLSCQEDRLTTCLLTTRTTTCSSNGTPSAEVEFTGREIVCQAISIKQLTNHLSLTFNGCIFILTRRVAIKLYAATKNQTYLDNFKQMYSWLKSSKIISVVSSVDWKLLDGISTVDCKLSPNEYSYHYGVLLSCLGEGTYISVSIYCY
jgi:Glycosyl hydrolase family 76